jgi:hypothetical protein
MKRTLILLSIAFFTVLLSGKEVPVHAADQDMDGVPDRYDRCPETPFFALVNKEGCTVKKLKVSREKEAVITKMLSKKN